MSRARKPKLTIIHFPFGVPSVSRRDFYASSNQSLQLAGKLARLRVEHPDAAALIEQLIDDAMDDRPEGGAE